MPPVLLRWSGGTLVAAARASAALFGTRSGWRGAVALATFLAKSGQAGARQS
jgi:hypothetical protein